LTPDLSCSKRARREDADGDLGCTGEDHHSSRLEVAEGEGRTEELVHLEAPASIVSSPAIAAEAGLTRAREAILMAVVAPPPAIGEATAGEVTAADVSSDPPSQEDARKVTVKAMEGTLVRVEAPEPSEPAARAFSSPEPALSARAAMSSFGAGIGTAAGPLLFGAASDSDKAPQGPLIARAAGSERDEASPAPDAATKDASGEKILATIAGSGVGSLSSASQLQQEWADTTSSAETSGNLKAQGNSLTLAELSRQLSAVKESLRNVNLQFLEATWTTDVSNVLSSFDFLCPLGGEACSPMTNFSLHPSPEFRGSCGDS
jgi:hypothetical protein